MRPPRRRHRVRSRSQIGEGQGQVAHIALGVEHNRWNTRQEGLFDEADTQPGFATSGHAHDDAVGGQMIRFVQNRLASATRIIDNFTEIERPARNFDHGQEGRGPQR
jgi:hypothetical protein